MSKKKNADKENIGVVGMVAASKPQIGPQLETLNEKKLSKKVYLRELARLHIELVKLQEWVKHKGLKVVVIFEGRDAAE